MNRYERRHRVKDIRSTVKWKTLENSRINGYNKGLDKGGKVMYENFFAATALVLHEKCGFDEDKIIEVLHGIDNVLIEYITSEDIRLAVLDKCGFEIHMEEGDHIVAR